MADFIVHGIPGSPYLRAALLGFEEKNIPWRLAPMAFGEHKTPEHRARHPFGRIPVVDHGDFRLYETQAILRYLDRLYPTPKLTPDDAKQEARMNQICGIVDWYLIHDVSAPITFQRVVASKFGLPIDEERLAAALPRAKTCIDELARLLDNQDYMAGAQVSIADLLLAPHLAVFAVTDEGRTMLAPHASLLRWVERMHARPSMQATSWEKLAQLAQAA
jgi:glutathione S-transferase